MATAGLLRSRLNERLARATQFPVALIVAPAGFGKSVALRDFLTTARVDAARYDVPREHATLLAFARGLASALADIAPGAIASFPSVQDGVLDAPAPVAALGEWFGEHLRRTVATIVIDDLHHAAVDPRSVELFVSLVERTSGRINWIVATRSDAGIPVASWVGYGRMDVPVGEDELRFTSEEALAAAMDAHADIAADEIDALRRLTEGWPVALAIALRTRTHATHLRDVTAGAREMVFRYLAEQVFASIEPSARAFLLESSVVASFDASLAQAFGGSAAVVEQLRRGAGFIAEIEPGVFRYHDLFRDFLESELRRAGPERWAQVHARAAALLEQRNDIARALHLYTKAGDLEEVLRIVAERGADLYERGDAETIRTALALIGERHLSDPRVLGVKAIVEAGRGAFDIAERDFIDAIARADDRAIRLALVQRYAIELIRHHRDAVALLAPYAVDISIAPAMRVPLLGTYATALARTGLLERAVEMVASGIEAIDGSVGEAQRARFYQQASFVHQLLPDRGNAWNYARLAVDLALAQRLYDVAARAYSVLYRIVYDDEDDPIESLALLDNLIDCARKAGSAQTRMYGVFASMDIDVDRADDAAIARLDAEIERNVASWPGAGETTLLAARAMRAAWEGDFERAYGLLAPSETLVEGDERRALRAAEVALYAFAAGDVEAGERAMERAASAVARGAAPRRKARTLLLLALAELLRGRAVQAHRFVTEAERLSSLSRRMRVFAQAVRVYYRHVLGQGDAAETAAVLERLRAVHFGGIARLLVRLPIATGLAASGGYAQLTAAERGILAALAGGRSSKEIAQNTGRSAQTVDTHIRSICRKLHCSGRREAVTLALRAGWVET